MNSGTRGKCVVLRKKSISEIIENSKSGLDLSESALDSYVYSFVLFRLLYN